ncbi:lysophosphatidic acid receptor 3 [Callorhinchus milii]|uniref:Lysophosphatidic acid receptor 3 n=1 Tax=Callorhinchus milii TaxID=7868 RepID=A0A4W3HQG5_CALMI|nr:lysophosphatidic acid receptor 3 [Callorhinchus milii]|eukprot:gi/632940581/ref/XP_007885395.1/ PREDICTED: lysophosphatidic acid receptor 3 [Callorhinchus milii]
MTCYYNESMEFFYNRSNGESDEDLLESTLILGFVIGSLFCLFIFLSNALVICAVVRNRRFHYPFYYLLANLAAADFFAGIAYVYLMFHTGPVSKTLTVHRYFLRQGLLDASLTASVANLLVIAVERYTSVMKMQVHSTLTKRRVSVLIVGIWTVAAVMGATPSMGWNCICNISTCSVLAPVYSRSFLIFWAVSNLFSFFIIMTIYLRIYLFVKKKTQIISPHTTGSIKRSKMPMKLVKTIMTVLGAFIICWTPGLVVVLLDGLQCKSCDLLSMKKWALMLALINSLMNPIIYSRKDREMWKTLKSMICCISQNAFEKDHSKSISTRQSIITESGYCAEEQASS